jgi:hypothetical protein
MAPDLDLADGEVRAGVTARLGGLYAGRPVIVAAGVLAAVTDQVSWLRALGCRVLVVCTTRGAGEVPDPDEAEVLEIRAPSTASVTQGLRTHDRLFRSLPPAAVAAVDAFDPERRGVWLASPFVTNDEPIAGRPVTAGRPAAFLALEDKLLAEDVWRAAGVPAAPSRIVPVDRAALAEATAALSGRLGSVWTGDNRGGFHGAGDFVRWVVDERDRATAFAFFSAHCDRVRVMPFLEGVPCSIHGVVLPEGTAAFRPVEIAVLRNPRTRSFVHGGLGTYWDPPAADRDDMRAIARRVGEHLRAAYSYRGAFGIDGVLTADGYRPTELNTRLSAGLSAACHVDRPFLTLLQANLLAGRDHGLTVADLESLLPLMDSDRGGGPLVAVAGLDVGGAREIPVSWDGRALHRSPTPTGEVVAMARTSTGGFAKVEPCAFLEAGDRLAPVNLALVDLLDRELGAGCGPLEAAPDVRIADPGDDAVGGCP